MTALQMFFYATVGSAALIFVIDRTTLTVKDAITRLKQRKALALRKRFHEAFESVKPSVDLWWEDCGRKEMRGDTHPMLSIMPEPIKEVIETQHCDAIKQAATQLAGGLVLKSSGKLRASELDVIDKENDEIRQHLLDHGINMDNFEKLFV